MNKEELIQRFSLLSTGNPGIESFVCDSSKPLIVKRLLDIEKTPLSGVQLNQLLGLAEEIGVSDGFFRYYWMSEELALYDLGSLPGYSGEFKDTEEIESLDQLYWGLYRIFVDGLLHNGNVRNYFRKFASKSLDEISRFVSHVRVDTAAVRRRGAALPLVKIPKDRRYLISEMACKTYGDNPETESALKEFLLSAFEEHQKQGGGRIAVKELLAGEYARKRDINQLEFTFSADDILDEVISSTDDINEKYRRIAKDFMNARKGALENTDRYLSLVKDLDVYVATSMRTRDDFREMADICDSIFADYRVKNLHLRYFDPTLSAAKGHADKGLIECLMVKCARVLIYCAGATESYGKDAEAAMALSLGKHVIFYCSKEGKARFYKDVHPLSRLINFETGVAVGALVTDNVDSIPLLLQRIYENSMQYELQQPKLGYLQLKERHTDSIVRLQTNDRMLSEAFWNYYGSTPT